MKFDWAKMRAEYISTQISQRELAKKYGASDAQVARHASNEAWAEARTNFASVATAKAEQKMVEKRSDALAGQFGQISEACENMTAMILKATKAERNFKANRKLDTRSVKSLTSALTDLVGVLRDVYEVPNRIDSARIAKQEGGGANTAVLEFVEQDLPEEEPQAPAEGDSE